MKIQIKYLDGYRWQLLDIKELQGKSICDYMLNTEREVVAALFEDEKPVMFVSNSEEQVSKYKEKGLSMHIKELALLMEVQVIPQVVAQVFPDGKFETVRRE